MPARAPLKCWIRWRSKAAPQPAPQQDVYYQNCTAARAAGVAPIYQGQPGYRSQLDCDHDGVACE
ncbi:excalibur calcium-binding domain-containing protein [Bifidobacterium catenulatum]|uniref:excalibur calcium-binding domain-containing protein n=1 Tax=Bifidobacterium catenulatum TaxID=1686 RepID=UPI003D34424A